jgi:hypothetical protein
VRPVTEATFAFAAAGVTTSGREGEIREGERSETARAPGADAADKADAEESVGVRFIMYEYQVHGVGVNN